LFIPPQKEKKRVLIKNPDFCLPKKHKFGPPLGFEGFKKISLWAPPPPSP